MDIQSVRDLKLELARDVFAPLVNDLLERARAPKLGTVPLPSPLDHPSHMVRDFLADAQFSRMSHAPRRRFVW